MFLIFKREQQIGLGNWLCVAIVYRVDLTVTGVKLRHSPGNESEDTALESIRDCFKLQKAVLDRFLPGCAV